MSRRTVTDLDIEGGRGHFRKGGPEKPYNWPAGVENQGNLTLRGVLVRRNQGIGVENAGRLRLNGDTIVGRSGDERAIENIGVHNTGRLSLNGTAVVRKGDVRNDGTLVMNGASGLYRSFLVVHESGRATLNDASHISEYGNVENRGILVLNDDSRIQGRGRVPGAGFVSGPGAFNFGALTLNDRSRISGWSVGVSNDGSVTLDGSSSIEGNGAGVFNFQHGSLTLNGSSSLRDNHYDAPPRCFPLCEPIGGGGVKNWGSVVLNDSSVIGGNSVGAWHLGSHGGGVYMVDLGFRPAPSLTMTGSAAITGNSSGDRAADSTRARAPPFPAPAAARRRSLTSTATHRTTATSSSPRTRRSVTPPLLHRAQSMSATSWTTSWTVP